MNILFITGMLPFPLDNGRRIRSYHLIKKLSEKNNLTLLISEEKNADIHSINEMNKLCQVIIVPYRSLSRMQLLFRLFLGLFHQEPFALLKRLSKNVQREIELLLDNQQIDVVICDRLTETKYIFNKHIKAIKVYSTHNLEYQIVQRFFTSTSNFFLKIIAYIEWKRTINYEKAVWKSFDFTITVSENDKKTISEFVPYERIFVIPNGVDTERYQPKINNKVPFSLIYTGQMGWYPNEDAVVYFTDEIYPLIKKEIPELKFFIVGSNTSKKVQRLGRGSNGIEVIGHVDNITAYIDKSTVYIVPLRIGGGTRIKILEAWAMGKAVISTNIGCEGLDVANGENIIIADKPNEFANRVVSLLEDEKTCQKLGNAGRKLVQEKYDWQIVYGQLDKLNSRLQSIVRES